MEQVIENILVNEAVAITTKEKRQHYKEQALSRVGQMGINTLGSLMIVDAYYGSTEVWVRFSQGNVVRCSWQQFQKGNVKNPYDKSVFGIGYLGEGNYKSNNGNGLTEQYKAWVAMLMRCYSLKFHEKNPSYIGCTVDERWHNFQTFAKWYDENHYTIPGQKIDLDKDILVKGNKVYSPEACIFTPSAINKLFLKRQAARGDLPIGVKRCTRNPKKYEAQCRNNTGKRIYLKYFDTKEEAFQSYKVYKEQLIKDIAEEYKECIPHTLYNAMLTYKVEIND